MSNFFSRTGTARGGPGGTSFSHSRSSRGRVPRAAAHVFAGAVALAVLTSCGGGGESTEGDGDVASLSSPAADSGGGPAPRKSTDPDMGRPRIRLDTTPDEVGRMYEAWLACLKENGAPNDKTKNKPDSPWIVKCQGKEPLPPAELDPARNPDFMDDSRAMVRCMNKHGFKSVLTEEGWGLEDGATMYEPQYDKLMKDCQVEAFGGK